MISKDTVKQIVESYITAKGYYLVDINVTKDNHISVEIDHFEGVSIDFCVELTREIESGIDRETEDYELQVSSAGLTEPFKVLKQYQKNTGNEVEVLTKEGKKITGVLTAADAEKITLQIEKQIKPEGAKRKVTLCEDLEIPYENIKTTKYIIRFK
ncbi:MAG TPA: ribosome assembly cofactor RimP [Paludibacteraceae bacterium]|mgnify:FL=1|nr:ribosome assembly cofactor RimP [Paludibacteraceae bacterium]